VSLSGGTAESHDELVKNCLTDYAAQNVEVASYQALIAAATWVGDQETATVCQQIMHDDQEMATWILPTLPLVAQTQMQEMARTGAV
jgi:ferritin-like metal-binding protein YciE